MKLPEITKTVHITFSNINDADLFIELYTRQALGHSIIGSTVTVYNVTNETMEWINNYVDNLKYSNNINQEQL